tara:strand:- start:1632 stop:2123 length:492 start_codon:yes stop_codon:yes gene_type:complete
MAQHDYDIANQSFPSFRSDLNSVLDAVISTNSGTSRPSAAVAGTLWYDTSDTTLKLYNGSADINVGQTSWSAKSSNFTATANSKNFVDTSGGAVTATLPASPSQGDEVRFVDTNGTFDTNNLTVDRNGKPIQGAASNLTVATERAGFGLVFYNDTQGWLLIEK